jgi:LacI family transcriptional regulator, gluconate utilization system Gnt-I transcriptional repressor
MSNPTLKDVARVAGVSPITVSRALRVPDAVAPSTRARVDAAVRETGYVPDAAAAQLASGTGNLFGVVVPTLEAPYFVDGLRGLADTAEAHGVSVTVGQTSYIEARAEALVRAMLGARPRGIAMFGPEPLPLGRGLLARSGIPVVEAWELVEDPIGLNIGFSHAAAMRELTERLIASGRRRPVFAARYAAHGRAVQRRSGFAEATAAAGLPARSIDRDGASGFEAGAAIAAAIVADRQECDALICAADNLAAGAIAEFARLGLRVPGDIAVAGFGDLDFAGILEPGLTTVRVPNREMGRMAAAFLLDPDWRRRLADGPRAIDVGYSIVARGSAPL